MIYRNGEYDLEDPTPWTRFWDMRSGGGPPKLASFDLIFIQEPKARAVALFMLLFDFDPERVPCEHCGPNYSIVEFPSLPGAAVFFIDYNMLPNLEKLVEQPDVLVVSQASMRIEHPPMWFEPKGVTEL